MPFTFYGSRNKIDIKLVSPFGLLIILVYFSPFLFFDFKIRQIFSNLNGHNFEIRQDENNKIVIRNYIPVSKNIDIIKSRFLFQDLKGYKIFWITIIRIFRYESLT